MMIFCTLSSELFSSSTTTLFCSHFLSPYVLSCLFLPSQCLCSYSTYHEERIGRCVFLNILNGHIIVNETRLQQAHILCSHLPETNLFTGLCFKEKMGITIIAIMIVIWLVSAHICCHIVLMVNFKKNFICLSTIFIWIFNKAVINLFLIKWTHVCENVYYNL